MNVDLKKFIQFWFIHSQFDSVILTSRNDLSKNGLHFPRFFIETFGTELNLGFAYFDAKAEFNDIFHLPYRGNS